MDSLIYIRKVFSLFIFIFT